MLTYQESSSRRYDFVAAPVMVAKKRVEAEAEPTMHKRRILSIGIEFNDFSKVYDQPRHTVRCVVSIGTAL